MVLPLRLIFQASYRSGVVLFEWRLSHTVPIHKKGSKAELN